MQIKGLGLGVMALVALVGCGSSSGTGTGGAGGGTSPGTGGGAGSGKGGSGSGKGGSGSGGSTGSGGAFTTSVPSGTKVTGLTATQSTQLCADLGTYFDNSYLPTICKGSTSLAGPEAAYFDLLENPTASISELQADCIAAAQVDAGCSDFVDAGTQTCDISSTPSTCEATVGDFTACINDMSAATVQFYASIPSCSSLTAASLKAFFAQDGGGVAGPPEPASCSKFDSTCSVDGGATIASSMSARMMPKRRR